MDINTIRGIGTIVVFISFISVLLWTFSSKRKERFEDDALIPFQDETNIIDQKNNKTVSRRIQE